ncbi:general secretion pathway protein GspB [Parashewanella tropica]|uniref:general secretion pathway protein GspB n=1 Tax=Parashewanella tropica TaxID=2547970 RepID=UPI00105A0483|nr:general secretion pathway protein GspB [Parashewanella tropica]
MSILLDAVTKSKQKNAPFDPTISPQRQLASVHSNRQLPWHWLGLGTAVVVGAIGAWWLLQPNVVNQTTKQAEPITTEAKPSVSSQVTLAGKVALPIPQSYQAPSQPVSNAQNPQSAQASTNSSSQSQAVQTASTTSEPRPIILGKPLDKNSPLASEYGPEQTQSDLEHAKELMLGAKPNNTQALDLEALKRQVALAASDVGLKTDEQHKQDKVINNLKQELSQVEHERAVNKPFSDDPKLEANAKDKYTQVPKYGELPAGVQLQVPQFTISAHLYSTTPSQRRLSVDGKELKEGDTIKGKLKILEIRPQDVVLGINGEKFSVPAA